jgi:hypothetical protein
MIAKALNLQQCQTRFSTKNEWCGALKQHYLLNGFLSSKFWHHQGDWVASRMAFQRDQCRRHISVSVDTIIHSTNLTLVQLFLVIYLIAYKKRALLDSFLFNQLWISLIKAHQMLRKMCQMVDFDSNNCLVGDFEFANTFLGRRRSGFKSGCGVDEKMPILVAIKRRDMEVGFICLKTSTSELSGHIRKSVQRHLLVWQSPRTEGLRTRCVF